MKKMKSISKVEEKTASPQTNFDVTFSSSFIPHPSSFFKGPLPGWEAQKIMAPLARLSADLSKLIQPDYKEGGVLLLLYPGRDANLTLVLIRRQTYNGAHSGQVSFPGGAREADESLLDTALRETTEEIGVPPQSLKVLGALTPVYIPPSNFMVYPYAAYSAARPNFSPNQREVAELIEVPLAMLLSDGVRQMAKMEIKPFGMTDVPCYNFWGNEVWGATAMILKEFKELVKNDKNTRH
jgi:8-oxo-dGTP pyrophosphatase MutT (NUDIX family)